MVLPPLTRRQRQILDFFQEYVRCHSLSPTLDEIAQAMGINKVTVFGHVAELERKGVLRRSARGISRALTLARGAKAAERASRSERLRILGTIAAGKPIEAVESPEAFDLSELAPRDKDVYALRVRGDSMIEDSICDGDLVLVERRTDPRNGDVVVAVLPGEHATLKRYYREGQRTRLQPANANLAPIYVDELEIRGIVRSVLRILH